MKVPLILVAILILLIFLPIVSYAEKVDGLDVEWEEAKTYTLGWTNPSVSTGDYVIKIMDFDWKGSAVVSVTRKEETQTGILSEAESTLFNFTGNRTTFQGVRITANHVSNYQTFPTNIGTYPCCPSIEMSVQIAQTIPEKKPELELALSHEWDGRSGYASIMYLEFRNTGNESFAGGNVTIDLNGLKPADEQELSKDALTYNPSNGTVTRVWYTPLSANDTYHINLSVKPLFPPQPNQSAFTIKIDSYFKDFAGIIYPAAATETVSLNQTINIDKRITESTIFGEKNLDEDQEGFVGLGKITVVNLYVTNMQSYPVNSVNLTDSVTEGFRLADNKTKLQWNFGLNASERKEFRYEMIAQKVGNFTAPPAFAQWTEWGIQKKVSSNSPGTRAYGAFMIISKKTNKLAFNLNESINVSVRLENTGDFPVRVNVTDIPPKNTTITSGTAAFSGYLRPLEAVELMYNLSANYPGELELPSPQVSFWKKDYEGQYSFIPAMNITVLAPAAQVNATNISQSPTPVPSATAVPEKTPIPKGLIDTVGEKAPWLEGAIPVVMLFVAIVLMLMLQVVNR